MRHQTTADELPAKIRRSEPKLSASIPPSLRPLLGTDPSKVTVATLQRIIGAEEGQHLELKEQVDLTTKSARREFALDVTSMANGGGGLLVIGIREQGETGRAEALVGVSPTTDGLDEALQMEQILGSLVQPPLPFSIERVDLGDGTSAYLVAVDAGPTRPHAVSSGEANLAYPVRRGRRKDYLSESEVADRYHERLRLAAAQAEELFELHAELRSRLDLVNVGWIVMALVPSTPGVGGLRMGDDRAAAQWLNSWSSLDDRSWGGWQARVDYRSVFASDGEHPVRVALLRHSGAVASARCTITSDREDVQRMAAPAAYWTTWVLDQLAICAEHARRVGATGSADISIQFVVADDCLVSASPGNRQWGEFGMRHQILERPGPSRVSRRSIDLGAVWSDPRALAQSTHLLVSDLLSEYGTVDLGLIEADGSIDATIAPHYPVVRDWAVEHGLLTSSG